ncbi:hypothetical protein IE077_003604, partial [Cardiosporidium cionae]
SVYTKPAKDARSSTESKTLWKTNPQIACDEIRERKTNTEIGVKLIDAFADVPTEYPSLVQNRLRRLRFFKERMQDWQEHLIWFRSHNSLSGQFRCELNPRSLAFNAVHTVVYNQFTDTLIVVHTSLPGHLQCVVLECQVLIL